MQTAGTALLKVGKQLGQQLRMRPTAAVKKAVTQQKHCSCYQSACMSHMTGWVSGWFRLAEKARKLLCKLEQASRRRKDYKQEHTESLHDSAPKPWCRWTQQRHQTRATKLCLLTRPRGVRCMITSKSSPSFTCVLRFTSSWVTVPSAKRFISQSQKSAYQSKSNIRRHSDETGVLLHGDQ